MDEMKEEQSDLAQMVRLALAEQTEDVRLFAARLVRKYRGTAPDLAEQLELFLKSKPARSVSPMRKLSPPPQATQAMPVDDESRLSLLKVFKDAPTKDAPLLSSDVDDVLGQLIAERRQSDRLRAIGLAPTRSAIFVGPPGVGKTLTARWLAAQLKVPLMCST